MYIVQSRHFQEERRDVRRGTVSRKDSGEGSLRSHVTVRPRWGPADPSLLHPASLPRAVSSPGRPKVRRFVTSELRNLEGYSHSSGSTKADRTKAQLPGQGGPLWSAERPRGHSALSPPPVLWPTKALLATTDSQMVLFTGGPLQSSGPETRVTSTVETES